MPYVIRKVRGKTCYSVKNAKTGRLHSICTSKRKAEAQVRLLMSYERGSLRR